MLVLLAWGSSIWRGGFAYDDREVLRGNPAVAGSVGWHQVFLREYWEHNPVGAAGHYRPTATATLRIDHGLHGLERPWGYHLTNVLLHLAVVLIAARLFKIRDKRVPIVGLALFAVHPVLADSVAWISGRTSMVSALGGLLGVLGVAAVARRGSAPGVALASAATALAAPLGKEDGVVFAVLALALAAERGRRLLLPAFLGAIVGGVAYLSLRHAALGAWLPGAPSAPLRDYPLLERMRISGGAGLEALRVLLLPIDYPPQWSLEDFENTGWVAASFTWILIALSLGAGCVKRSCDAFTGLALAALAALPFAQLVPAGELLAARFLYLPLLFAAPAIHSLWRETGSRPGIAVAFLAPAIVLSILRAEVYASRASYWEARLEWRKTPEGHNALGNAHVEVGDRYEAAGKNDQAKHAWDLAERSWRDANDLNPNYSRPWVNRATLATRRKEWAAAEQLLLHALGVSARNPVAWANLGAVRFQLDDPEGAARAYERALELSPDAAALWRGLARARHESGDEEGAIRAIEAALARDPDDPIARARYEHWTR